MFMNGLSTKLKEDKKVQAAAGGGGGSSQESMSEGSSDEEDYKMPGIQKVPVKIKRKGSKVQKIFNKLERSSTKKRGDAYNRSHKEQKRLARLT